MKNNPIYTTTHPITGEVVTITGPKRAVRWATWRQYKDGSIGFGFSSADSHAKALAAAKSTNPYASAFFATELRATEVSA